MNGKVSKLLRRVTARITASEQRLNTNNRTISAFKKAWNNTPRPDRFKLKIQYKALVA